MDPESRCMSGNRCGRRMSWTYRWAVMIPRDSVLQAMVPHTITPAVGVVCRCKAKARLKRPPRVQFPPARHHSKRRRRWVGVKGRSRNEHRDPKCPSARRLRMVREDLVKVLPVRLHFLRCGGLLDDWSVEGVRSLVFM
ncbi:uncharacterized protein TNCV_1981171 [Trichonephila clavipes]|nr:uncharacterized protein TNCV_1981171 [Trichonephila clavipes]